MVRVNGKLLEVRKGDDTSLISLMGVGSLIVALTGVGATVGATVGCPAADRGLLERLVRGPSSARAGSGGGATTLLREGEARVRVVGAGIAVLAATERLVCAVVVVGTKSSIRRGRLKRRSILVSCI